MQVGRFSRTFVFVLCSLSYFKPVSLDCPFLIALSVFSHVYSFCLTLIFNVRMLLWGYGRDGISFYFYFFFFWYDLSRYFILPIVRAILQTAM